MFSRGGSNVSEVGSNLSEDSDRIDPAWTGLLAGLPAFPRLSLNRRWRDSPHAYTLQSTPGDTGCSQDEGLRLADGPDQYVLGSLELPGPYAARRQDWSAGRQDQRSTENNRYLIAATILELGRRGVGVECTVVNPIRYLAHDISLDHQPYRDLDELYERLRDKVGEILTTNKFYKSSLESRFGELAEHERPAAAREYVKKHLHFVESVDDCDPELKKILEAALPTDSSRLFSTSTREP